MTIAPRKVQATLVEIRKPDYAQRYETTEGEIIWLKGHHRPQGVQLGDEGILTFVSEPNRTYWVFEKGQTIMKYKTPLLETEAILAALQEDTKYLQSIIAKMNKHECVLLSMAALTVRDTCLKAIQQQEEAKQ